MVRLVWRIVTVTASIAFCGGIASAQTSQSQSPPSTDISRQNGNLSDKLDATNGVIHPEATIDPKMEKNAPATGRMPVVPPAGTPGGAPDVQPK